MNSQNYNFSRNLDALTDQDMYAISQDLNTIEPSVGEVGKALPLLERLTFLDYVSIAFVMTILVFTLMPIVKRSKFWNALRPSSSR